MYLVAVDAHSKWLEVLIMPSITSTQTIQKLRTIFATHGLPKKVVTDNGPSFVSQEFKRFMSENGIVHVTSAPYHPSTNGLAERAVRTFKQGLQLTEGDSLQDRLSKFLFRYRVTPHSTTGLSPAEMLLKRRVRTRLDVLYPEVNQKVEKSQQKQKLAHDNSKPLRSFAVGDHIYAQNFSNSPSKWIPATVLKATGPLSYQVKTAAGEILRRHVDQLRRKHKELVDPLSFPDTDQIPPPPPIRRSTRQRNPPNFYS